MSEGLFIPQCMYWWKYLLQKVCLISIAIAPILWLIKMYFAFGFALQFILRSIYVILENHCSCHRTALRLYDNPQFLIITWTTWWATCYNRFDILFRALTTKSQCVELFSLKVNWSRISTNIAWFTSNLNIF